MLQTFQPGDFLIFQIESGYGLLRVLAVDETADGGVWHLMAYADLFLDVEMADAVLANGSPLTVAHPHLALTTRAFESTQVSRMQNTPLTHDELAALQQWRTNPNPQISDRSVRLLMGLR